MSCRLRESATRVLGVHGVGNVQAGLSPDAASARIAGWWRAALSGLPAESIDLQINYYADLIAGSTPQGDGDLGHLGEEVAADIVQWASQMGVYPEVAQGRLTQPARAGVDWVARRFGLDRGLVARFVEGFFPEVHRYFADVPARGQVLHRVAAQIREWRPRILIGHSLGSVVAYEALWLEPDLAVDLLLTLGSPLAMPNVVYDRLTDHPGSRSRHRPPGVTRWVNIADRGDIIAIPTGGVGRGFGGVAADITESIHAFDFHRVTNYLSCPTTTAALAATL